MQDSGIRRDYQLSVALRHQLSAKERAQESQLRPSPALAVQVVAQPWPRALHQPHQAALAFPFPLGAGGSSCCLQMLFMQHYYLGYIGMLLESLVPPD